jgi:hypothetical protein
LAEPTLQIDVDTVITLPEPAIEIKRIQKRLKLTQSTLIQDTNKLFVKGFVRKNIEYATAVSSTSSQVNGAIKHATVDVPFSTIAEITFDRFPAELQFNSVQNFEFNKTEHLPPEYPEKDRLYSGDLSEFNQINTEYFNELPYIELVSSRFIEYDEYLNRKPLDDGIDHHSGKKYGKKCTGAAKDFPWEEKKFKVIEEKLVIFLTFKILQKQQVHLSALFEVDPE